MALRRPWRPETVDAADPAHAQEFRPGTVRVLAVVWWVFAAYLAVDLVSRGGAGQLMVGVPLVVLSAVVVHALFWHPAVRVSEHHVELVNVLRTVRIPWSSLEQLDTRWALTLVADGCRWTAWAAPSSGRRYRPVGRRETPWAGRDDAAIAGSRAPGSSAGEAAVLVDGRWQAWKDRPRPAGGDSAGGSPVVTWNRGVSASLAVAAVAVVLGVLAVA